jgi:cell division septum initiation protein DivIVA
LKGVIPIDIQQLVDYLENIVGRGVKLPGGKVILNRNELDNLVDQLRIAIPQEIHQAKEVLAGRENAVSRPHNQSQPNLHLADDSSTDNPGDHALLREAEGKAQSVIQGAQEEAVRITNGADDYAEESLRQLAQSIIQLNAVIQNGLHALALRRSQRAQKSSPEANTAVTTGL